MKNGLLLLLLLISTIASAQLKFGPKVGVNLSGAFVSPPDDDANTRSSASATQLTSFCIGGMGELRLGENFALQLSLLASRKGYNFVEVIETQAAPASGSSYVKSSVITNRGVRKLFYIDLPLALVYKKDLGIGKILFGLGGYYSYCLWGVSEEENTYVVGSDFDLSLSSMEGTYDLIQKEELIRSDYGAVFMTGLEFNEKLQLAAQYNLGIAGISPTDASARNRVVSITVTYLFGGD